MHAPQDRSERFSYWGLIVLTIIYAESESEVITFLDELDLTFEFLLEP
jgi:hypothetical protein